MSNSGFIEDNKKPAPTPRGRGTAKPSAPADEKPILDMPVFSRTEAFRTGADGGNSERFYNTYLEIIKESGKNENNQLYRINGELLRQLNQRNGYLIYASCVGNDLLWHIIVLEGDKQPVQRRNALEIGRRRADVFEYQSTIDGFTNDVVDMFEEWVKTNIRVNGEYVYSALTIVPAEARLDDQLVVKTYLESADDANYMVAGTDKPFDADYLHDNSTVRGSIAFTFSTLPGSDGAPIRADFTGSVRESIDRANPNIILANDRGETYVSVTGYIDARWAEPAKAERGRDASYACYAPEIVLTDINLYHDARFGNLERLALGLAMVPPLNTDNRWMQQFMPGINKTDLQNFRGFGYGLTIPGVAPTFLDVTEEQLNDSRTFADTMDDLFQFEEEGVEVSLIIREGSVGYATKKILIDIANGSTDSEDIFIDAINDLTDNKFGALWAKAKDQTIVVDAQRLPYGYWTNKDGIRPIEEIDTLAVENRLKNSFPEMLDDWFAVTALGGSSFDSDERMTKLVDIYQQVTQNTFVMKGFATKVTFGAEFLECIYDAISKTDMAISVDFEGDQGFSRGRRGSGRRYGIRNDMARNDRGTHDNRSRGDRYVQTGYRRGGRR